MGIREMLLRWQPLIQRYAYPFVICLLIFLSILFLLYPDLFHIFSRDETRNSSVSTDQPNKSESLQREHVRTLPENIHPEHAQPVREDMNPEFHKARRVRDARDIRRNRRAVDSGASSRQRQASPSGAEPSPAEPLVSPLQEPGEGSFSGDDLDAPYDPYLDEGPLDVLDDNEVTPPDEGIDFGDEEGPEIDTGTYDGAGPELDTGNPGPGPGPDTNYVGPAPELDTTDGHRQ